jgi:hypothetical protein
LQLWSTGNPRERGARLGIGLEMQHLFKNRLPWGGWLLRNWVLLVAACLVLLKLWLVSAQPILAVGLAAHDDRLFIDLARSLLEGQWLGPYNERTLAKGCFYPVWIALTSRVGVPLLLSQHLLCLAAVLTFVAAVRPVCARPPRLLLLGALLWLNPATYASHVLRVMREGIYPALALLVVAGMVGIGLRLKGGWRWGLGAWVAAAGLALAAFWQTREEGIWLLPLIAVIAALALSSLWRDRTPRRWSLGLVFLLPLGAIPGSNWLVARINQAHYGYPVAVEFRAHDFVAAYGALTRVKPKSLQPHVQVSKEVRERIYAVSPTFAKLKPHLDGLPGLHWAASTRRQWPELGAGEIGGGWFVWAFRQAVAIAGCYASGEKTLEFYRSLAREISTACQDGRLACLPARTSMMPPWQPGYSRALFATFAKAIPFVVGFQSMSATPLPSSGAPSSQALFREVTHDRIAPLGSFVDVRVQGWLVGGAEGLQVSVRDASGAPVDVPIVWQPSPDVLNAFRSTWKLDLPWAGQARFDIVVPQGASIVVKSKALRERTIPLDGKRRSASGPELYYNLDSLVPVPNPSTTGRIPTMKVGVLNRIMTAYQWAMPILASLAFLAFLVLTVRVLRTREVPDGWVMQVGLLAAIAARLTILSLVEITSFPAIDPLYLTSAYPFVISFVCLALHEGAGLLPPGWVARLSRRKSQGEGVPA